MENLTKKHNSTKETREREKKNIQYKSFLLLLFKEHDRAQKGLKCNKCLHRF